MAKPSTQLLPTAFLVMAVPALGLSSISTLAAGLAWLFISLAGVSAWLSQSVAGTPTEISKNSTLQATAWWLMACVAAFVLMAIATAYWGGPWPERHPQWRLLIGAGGLWLLLRYSPPRAGIVHALASAAALSSILAYGLVITVSSDAAPTNRIPWMAGLSLLSCALLSMSYSMQEAALRLRQFWLAASALMVVTVLLSGVRGSWPLVIIWPVMLWCLHKSSPMLWRSVWRWLLPLLAVLLTAGLALIPEKDNPAIRIIQVSQETGLQGPADEIEYNSSSGVRLGLYFKGLQHVFDHPILGTGPAGTKQLIRQTLEELRLQERLSIIGHMHNDPLHAWVEFGLFGLAGYFAFAAGIAVAVRKMWINQPNHSMAVGLAGLLLMHLITGMSNMNFAHNYYPTMLSVSIALILACCQTSE